MPLTKKKFSFCVFSCLFFGHSHFLFSFLNMFFLRFSFLLSFLNVSLFLKILFDLIILFLSVLHFLPLHTFLSFEKTTFFSTTSVFFFLRERERRCVPSPIQHFHLFECLLCLFVHSFRSSSIHLFSFLSLRVLRHFNFYFSCSWIVSSFSLSVTFLHNFLNHCKLLLNFLFLFFFSHQKTLLSVFFCWTCFTFIFLVLSYVSVSWKMVSPVFAFFACLLWCIWKNVVFQPKHWWRHLLLFLFLPFFLLFVFSCLFVFEKSVWNK